VVTIRRLFEIYSKSAGTAGRRQTDAIQKFMKELSLTTNVEQLSALEEALKDKRALCAEFARKFSAPLSDVLFNHLLFKHSEPTRSIVKALRQGQRPQASDMNRAKAHLEAVDSLLDAHRAYIDALIEKMPFWKVGLMQALLNVIHSSSSANSEAFVF
jgi:hypothetical protein